MRGYTSPIQRSFEGDAVALLLPIRQKWLEHALQGLARMTDRIDIEANELLN